MSEAKPGRYASRGGDGDSIEELSKRLTADLRRHIRGLGACAILSEEWNDVADCLARIADISQMEKELPKEKDATLWDCEELALRYVLEDGKLNLCLRLLEDYVDFIRRVGGERAVSEGEADRLKTFERGIGALLANAWLHVEALQTTDIPLMIRLSGEILEFALAHKDDAGDKLENRLPAVVVHFLFALGKALDHISERRVFPELMSRSVFQLLVQHLATNSGRLSAEDRTAGAEALALLAAAEDFSTNKARIVGAEAVQLSLVALDTAYVASLASTPDVRRKLRPLLDLISEAKRKVGAK